MKSIQPADHYELSRVSDVQLSPAGTQVAFVLKRVASPDAYETGVYLLSADGGTPTRFVEGQGNDRLPRWSPDGDRIAFVSTRGNDERPQLWVARAVGDEPTRVTNVPGGVGRVAWSPDGTSIAFVQETTPRERAAGIDLEMPAEYVPEEPDPRRLGDHRRFIHRFDRRLTRTWDRWYDDARSHIYVADLVDESVTRVTDGDRDHHSLAWADPTTLYYTARRTGTPDDRMVHDIVAFDGTSGDHEVITRTGHTNIWWPAIAASGLDRIAFTYMEPDRPSSRQTEIEVHDRESGQTTTVTEDLDHTIVRSTTPTFSTDGETVYFLTLERGSVALREAPADGDAPPTVVLGGPESTHGLDRHRDVSIASGRVAFVQRRWDRPSDVVVARLDGNATDRLTDVNENFLQTHSISEPEAVWFDSPDGSTRVQGWVLYPPDADPATPYPLIAVAHGGPHVMTTETQQWHEFQSFAAAGFAVFWCNYRGSTGYGQSFQEGNLHDWGGADYADIVAGVDAIAERQSIDDGNLFLTGMSYGGYLSAWAVGQTDRFSAAITKAGFYCLPSVYGNTDKFEYLEWELGAAPWEDPEWFWKRSPVAHADEVTTPTLIVIGDEDYTTPLSDAEVLYRYLERNGVETRLDVYPGEGHGLLTDGNRPRYVVDRFDAALDWFEHHRTVRTDDGVEHGAD